MQRMSLRRVLAIGSGVCLLVSARSGARAQRGWTIYPLMYEANTTFIDPPGSSLGSGGFCNNTGSAISAALVNTLSVTASAHYSVSQTAAWESDGAPGSIAVDLSASVQGVFEEGAVSNSGCYAHAEAKCLNVSAARERGEFYPDHFSDHAPPMHYLFLALP